MLIKNPTDIRPSEITNKSHYLNRRNFMRAAAATGSTLVTGETLAGIIPKEPDTVIDQVIPSNYSTDERPNSYADITTYNNYYEFGIRKDDPHRNSQNFKPRPWSITVAGNAERTGEFAFEDIIKLHQLEERIYRLRCVEAWSMVIPWVGIPLANIVKSLKPLSSAKYVVFETLYDPERMPGQRSRWLNWPYVEGLTIAEATNPLPILAVGLYGKVLPNQNGAPIRLIVPWKYGFKSIKGITKIYFSETQPRTSWELAAPHEYGFYANVNPEVDHPRWSQARERRIGSEQGAGLSSLFATPKQPTVMFNGYGEHVAHLYKGLDLKKHF